MASTVKTYRVCYFHKAGHLQVQHVEAQNKAQAEQIVRAANAPIYSRTSSVTLPSQPVWTVAR